MRFLVATDKFRGSLTAAEAARHIATGIRAARPTATIVSLPVADGGEGTVDAAVAARYDRVAAAVAGPTGQPVQACFAIRDGTAVVEIASASGLARLPTDDLAPLSATSLGTGQLVRVALDRGCTEIVLGVGGSASTDGGAGLLVGLGARVLDGRGRELPLGGGALAGAYRLDLTRLDNRLGQCHIVLASDVDNPLLGPLGAAAVFGPQKGASPQDVRTLESALTRWVTVCADSLGAAAHSAAGLPGAGADGGAGYAALAVLGAERRPGAHVVLEFLNFASHLAHADLVVAGEGTFDHQTLRGKVPAAVAAGAAAAGVPVVVVAGRVELSAEDLADAGFHTAYALSDLEPDHRRSMRDAGALLERVGAQIAADWMPADAL